MNNVKFHNAYRKLEHFLKDPTRSPLNKAIIPLVYVSNSHIYLLSYMYRIYYESTVSTVTVFDMI